MKIGKGVLAAVVATVFNSVAGMVFCGGIFNWVYKLEPVNIWKPMDGAPGLLFFVGSFVLSVIFVAVYAILRNGIPGKTLLVKGLLFGLCVFGIGLLPGMFATHTFMVMNSTVVVYWTLMGVFQLPIKGAIVALIYGE